MNSQLPTPNSQLPLTNSSPPSARTFFGLSLNVVWLGVVSFLNDLSSDMIFPFIPIFLTSVLGASLAFVGVVEGIAEAGASFLKIGSGWLSDRTRRKKPFVVAGYSLSALAKPALASAAAPWHVLAIRFLDRAGKGSRDAPRDALISVSTEPRVFGRAFGFHRAMDTLGAALGPLAAFAVLPLINQDLRILFLLSFVASFFAVLALVAFVREPKQAGESEGVEPERKPMIDVRQKLSANALLPEQSPGLWDKGRGGVEGRPALTPRRARGIFFAQGGLFTGLGAPFFLFLGVSALASLGKASEAFLILRGRELGIALGLIPILYFAFNSVFALLSTPAGIVADRIGKRKTYALGLVIFALVYAGFALASRPQTVWLLFALYGLYAALTEGVGRAIVADLVPAERRSTAFGVYHASTGLALLPGSVVFGYMSQWFGSAVAFSFGAALASAAALIFVATHRRKT